MLAALQFQSFRSLGSVWLQAVRTAFAVLVALPLGSTHTFTKMICQVQFAVDTAVDMLQTRQPSNTQQLVRGPGCDYSYQLVTHATMVRVAGFVMLCACVKGAAAAPRCSTCAVLR